jgi:hypothetical protein
MTVYDFLCDLAKELDGPKMLVARQRDLAKLCRDYACLAVYFEDDGDSSPLVATTCMDAAIRTSECD